MKRIFAFLLLGVALTAFAGSAVTLDHSSQGDRPAKTTILSQTLEMVSSDSQNTFYFSGNVQVSSTDLDMTADKMVVISTRGTEDAQAKAPLGTIEKIVAAGNVHISQKDRQADAGRAEFYPTDGKMILTDSPKVTDAKAVVSGWRITLFQNQRKVVVEQDPNGTSRPSVDLESLPDMSPPSSNP